MKRLCFLLTFAAITTIIRAGVVSEQDALLKAKQFMPSKTFHQQEKVNRTQKRGVQSTPPAYYIFNADENNGFVIVSADDRTEEILGYSDNGSLNYQIAPDNVKWLLDYYNNLISSLDVQVQSPDSTRHEQTVSRNAINYLISTQWGQGDPYNSMCPIVDGQHCVTGCVATAMAQIINYCKWPQTSTTTAKSYTTVKNEISMPQLDSTSFNWDNITDEDIARLMLYCGYSVQMDYGLSSSGAYLDPVVNGLTNTFGYSKTVKNLRRTQYSKNDEHWESILYSELSENRPVLYSGGGHAWIIDGYQDGAFHMNWGWNGDYDGYYRITEIADEDLMKRYEEGQNAIIGIRRPITIQDNNVPKVIAAGTDYYGQTYLYRANTSENFPVTSINSYLYSDLTGDFYVGYGLFDLEDNLIKILSSEQHSFVKDEEYRYYGSITIDKDIEPGVYKIVAICSEDGKEWNSCLQSNCEYLKAIVDNDSLFLEIMPQWDPNANSGYREVGEYDIDGITYLLYNEFGNDLAKVLPYHKTGKYSGDIVVPSEIDFKGTTYRVFYDDNAFVLCDSLSSLTIGETSISSVTYCPNLTNLTLMEGVVQCPIIYRLPQLKTIEIPATLYYINSPHFISDCNNLKTISFKGTMCKFYSIPEWDNSSLPSLTDIYFPSGTPFPVVDWNDNPQGDVPANTNAIIHIPVGSLKLYQKSAWKNWTFIEDLPVQDSVVTWSYCHGDVTSDRGFSVSTSGNNDYELAMRVPAEEMSYYVGSRITEIQLFSPNRAPNDYHHEDYEYVLITEPGTDYIVKQPFNVVRGAWNTIILDTPYTITGEEIYVGFGRHGDIGVMFSDMTNQPDAVWMRPMGDDYGCIGTPGVWARQNNYAHPLPLRFTIEGDSMPTGVVIRELELIDNTENGDSMAIQGTIRNRSLENIESYTVEWTIDDTVSYSKVFETSLIPNTCEFITINLPEYTKQGYHVVSVNVSKVNNHDNVLSGMNPPVITIGIKPIVVTANSYTRVYGDPNPTFEYSCDEPTIVGTPIITCNATDTSSVGTYPISIAKGTVMNSNVVFTDGTLTVTKAPLIIKANDYSIWQDDELPEFTLTYQGFKNNEDSTVLTKLPLLTSDITSTCEPGEYIITVSDAEAQNYEITYLPGKLTIKERIPGDVTASGVVDIQDATIVVNYILGERSDKYVYYMADMNKDDEIDVFDITAMINVILSKPNFTAPMRASAGRYETDYYIASNTPTIPSVGLEDAYLRVISDKVYLNIDETQRFTSFQMDVEVPDGAELLNVEVPGSKKTHSVQKSKIGDNLYRVIGLSMTSQLLAEENGELVNFQITNTANMGVAVKNIMFVTPKGDAHYFNESSTMTPTFLNNVIADKDEIIYDLSGRRINKKPNELEKGIYIINKEKVVIK